MFRKTLILGVAALMAGTALPALAQSDAPDAKAPAAEKRVKRPDIRGNVTFWLLDRNEDGKIDQSEIDALRAKVFEAADANSDGSISAEEFAAMMPRGPHGRGKGDHAHGPRHMKWSKHHDERRGGWHRGPRHERAEDGERHRGPGERPRIERSERSGAESDGPRRARAERPSRAEFAEKRAERMMERMGIDPEKGLTKDAFLAKEPRVFGRADRNDDGAITPDELRGGQIIDRLLTLR